MTEIINGKAKCLESFSAVEHGIQRVGELFQTAQSETGQLKQEIQRLRGQLDHLKSDLGLREATIARLEKDLQWRDHQLAELNRIAAEPRAEVAEPAQETLAHLEEVVRSKDQQIEQLQLALASAVSHGSVEGTPSSHVEELQAAILARDLDLERMQRTLEAKQEHLQRLRQEREEIKARVRKILSTL